MGVGALLCWRAAVWIAGLGYGTESIIVSVGIGLAYIGYTKMFTNVVRRSIDRIETLPASVCAFAFTAWRGYLMMGGMIVLGLALRNSSIPKYYLSIPYAAMGLMLLTGSARFYHRFALDVLRSE